MAHGGWGALVVDDNLSTARLWAACLSRLGVECRHATSVEGGLRAALARRPDLVVVDMWLDDGTGAELVAGLRRLPALAGVPMLGVSGADDADRLLAACDKVLRKPVRVGEFIEASRGLLGLP